MRSFGPENWPSHGHPVENEGGRTGFGRGFSARRSGERLFDVRSGEGLNEYLDKVRDRLDAVLSDWTSAPAFRLTVPLALSRVRERSTTPPALDLVSQSRRAFYLLGNVISYDRSR